jgi:hypothetical protein
VVKGSSRLLSLDFSARLAAEKVSGSIEKCFALLRNAVIHVTGVVRWSISRRLAVTYVAVLARLNMWKTSDIKNLEIWALLRFW